MTAASVITALVTAAPSSAASLPDLVALAPSSTAAAVVRGHGFVVSTTVKNQGAAAAAASTLRFYLSGDRLRGAGDRRLVQVRQVGRLGPGAASTGATTLRPAATTPAATYYVIGCADDLKVVGERVETNNCKPSSHAISVVPGPTSEDLIDRDLAAGILTPTAAMLDKVYAAFGDSRLPAKYRGDDGSVVDSGEAVAAAAAAFNGASSQTRAALIPFLKAPAYPNTWENLATAPKPQHEATVTGPPPSFRRDPVPHPSTLGEPGWSYYQHPKHVRIWYHTASQHEHVFALFVYAVLDKVWNKLTALMGRVPTSDAGPHPYTDPQGQSKDWGDGGSGDLDIFFADLSKPAVTQPYPPNCTDTPSYIVINPNIDVPTEAEVLPIVAHEFMHVLQFRFHYQNACAEYDNLDEATAQWAIHYVSPTNDWEHRTNAFLPNPGAQLWRQRYDGWPFELFLQQTTGPGAIAQTYAHTESSGPWEAVNAAVVGGLDKQWPDFAVKAWNQVPVKPAFKEWDALGDVPLAGADSKALEPQLVSLGGKHQVTVPTGIFVPALSRQYDIYTFGNDVVKVEFQNLLNGEAGAGVHALVQLANGTWKEPQDWTDLDSVTYCRDRPSENVKKLVVITTDSTFNDLQHTLVGSEKIVASDDCLPSRYAGTFNGSATPKRPTGYQPPTETWSGSVTFEKYTGPCSSEWWCFDNSYQTYEATAGSVTWHIQGTNFSCSIDFTDTFSLAPFDHDSESMFLLVEKKPASGEPRLYYGAMLKPRTDVIPVSCPDGPDTFEWHLPAWWGLDGIDTGSELPNGDLQGTFTLESDFDSNQVTVYNWDFSPSG